MILCRCAGEPDLVPADEHGRLHVGTDTMADGTLWAPAWPETAPWERRSRAALKPRVKRFRVIRAKGSPLPPTWHYSFFG